MLFAELDAVTLDAFGTLPGDDFADGYMSALVFEPMPGTERILRDLRRRGLELAVISNWDVGLHFLPAPLATAFHGWS